jgi:hypothetical protein
MPAHEVELSASRANDQKFTLPTTRTCMRSDLVSTYCKFPLHVAAVLFVRDTCGKAEYILGAGAVTNQRCVFVVLGSVIYFQRRALSCHQETRKEPTERHVIIPYSILP